MGKGAWEWIAERGASLLSSPGPGCTFRLISTLKIPRVSQSFFVHFGILSSFIPSGQIPVRQPGKDVVIHPKGKRLRSPPATMAVTEKSVTADGVPAVGHPGELKDEKVVIDVDEADIEEEVCCSEVLEARW